MLDKKLLQTAMQYFKDNKILDKLAGEFCEKYRSLGYWGGTVEYLTISGEDRKVLGAFLQQNTFAAKKIRVSYKKFCQAWLKTRFSEIKPEEFFAYYYNGQLISKKDSATLLEEKCQLILADLLEEFPEGLAGKWLAALKYGDSKLYRKELYTDAELLRLIASTLAELPSKYERLPFFANRITGDPHGFDQDQPAGRILLQALVFLAGNDIDIKTVDGKNELLYNLKSRRKL